MKRPSTCSGYVTALAVGLLFVARAGLAEEPKGDRPVEGLRGEIRDEIREYVDDQRGENREFRKSLEGLTPAQRCAAIRKHHAAQHSENVTFAEQEYQKVIERLKQRMVERGVPAEKQAKVLANAAERHAKRKALAESQFQARMALLDTLSGKPDLTAEEMRTQIKALLEKQRAEREALHASLRSERSDARRGEGPRPTPQP